MLKMIEPGDQDWGSLSDENTKTEDRDFVIISSGGVVDIRYSVKDQNRSDSAVEYCSWPTYEEAQKAARRWSVEYGENCVVVKLLCELYWQSL